LSSICKLPERERERERKRERKLQRNRDKAEKKLSGMMENEEGLLLIYIK